MLHWNGGRRNRVAENIFNNPTAEKRVLAALLIDDNVLNQQINNLGLADFNDARHQYMFEILDRFYRKYYKSLDRNILDKWLSKHDPDNKTDILLLYGELHSLGCDKYVKFYIDELKECAANRALRSVNAEIVEGLETGTDPAKIASSIAQQILTTSTTSIVERTSVFADPDERIQNYIDREEHPEKYRGVPYGIKEIDKLTGGMFPGQLYLVIGRTGSGKCIKFDSQLVMADGTLRPIQDVVNSQEGKVLTLSNNWNKLRTVQPVNYMYSGEQEVFKVTTKSGRTIEVTHTHPLLTVEGWQPLQSVAIGDRIAVPREIPIFGKSKLPSNQVRLLAYLIAEGNLSTQSIGFTNYDLDIRADFCRVIEDSNIADLKVTVHGTTLPEYKRTLVIVGKELTPDKVRYGKNKYRRLTVNPIKGWLKEFGLLGKKSVQKTIPDEIFKLPKEKLAVFLAVLWSCDGSIYGETLSRITFETGSPKLTRQVGHLLLRFGILTRYWEHCTTCNGKKFIVGSLEVIGSCRAKFLNEIGPYFVGKKCARVTKALKFLYGTQQNTNVDTIPMNLIKPYLPITRIDKIDRKKIANAGCKFEFNYSHDWNKYGICRDKVEELADVLNSQSLKKLATADIFWDTVKSIECTGLADTYDLEISSTHNFVTNDIIVHNSRSLFNIGCNAAKAGKMVMYCTIEMDAQILQYMWESREAKIPLTEIMRTELVGYNRRKYMAFLQHQKKVQHPLYLIDIPQGCTTGIIESEVLAFEKLHGQVPDLVLIDYANLIRPMSKFKDRAEMYDHVFRELKEGSRAHKTIYYTAAQMNRESLKATKQGTEHIAFSDASSYHCDSIFRIFADEKDEVNHEVHFEVIKGRYHQGSCIDLCWKRDINWIGSWSNMVRTLSKDQSESQNVSGSAASSTTTEVSNSGGSTSAANAVDY